MKRKSSIKNVVSLILLCTLLLCMLGGCQKAEKPAEPTVAEAGFKPTLDTKQTAEFTIVGNLSNFEALEAVIAEFKKVYPNVTITYEKMDDYNNMVEKRLKNDPAVGCYLSASVSEDCEVDLLTYNYDTSSFSNVIRSGMKNGKLLSIPMGISVRGMVVNVSLLEKEGLKIPHNMKEFTDVCDALLQKGYVPIQQTKNGYARNIMQNYVWGMIAEAEDEAALVAQLSSGKPGSMECMRPAFELFESFYTKGYISPEVSDTIANDYDAAILHFFEGKTPFLAANSDTVSGMQKRESKSETFTATPFDYHFMYVPLAENGVYAEQSAWNSICVSSYAAQKDLAVEFLRFLGTTDNLNLLARVKGIPSASNMPTDSRFANLHAAAGTYIYAWEHDIPYVVWNSIVARIGEYANATLGTLDEALATVENDIVVGLGL